MIQGHDTMIFTYVELVYIGVIPVTSVNVPYILRWQTFKSQHQEDFSSMLPTYIVTVSLERIFS